MNISERVRGVYQRSTCVFTKADVDAALDTMAYDINTRLEGKNPVFLCVLLGGIVPMGNLLPRLNLQLEINYLHASSYAGTTGKVGELNWKAKPTIDLAGRAVVVVDDILDTGLTLQAAVDYCYAQGATEVFTAVLLDKRKPRSAGGLQEADFKALTMDDRFVFGYGLDYAEYLRNAPGIYVVAPEDM